jgi:hypothetical protein
MRQRLELNGFEVDLLDNLDIALSLSITDATKPEQRRRSVSKTFSLQGTAKNRSFFYATYSTSIDTDGDATAYNPAQRVSAKLYDGEVLIFDGLFLLNYVELMGDDIVFHGTLFSNFLELYEKLGELTIAELGWGEYAHVLNDTNIVKSFQETVVRNNVSTANHVDISSVLHPRGFGYRYCMIDWGLAALRTSGIALDHFSNSLAYPRFIHNEIIPLVYVSEVFFKMMNAIGLDWNGGVGELIRKPQYSSFTSEQASFWYLLLGYEGGKVPSLTSAEITERAVTLVTNATAGVGLDYVSRLQPTYDKAIQGLGGVEWSSYKLLSTGRQLNVFNALSISSKTDVSNQYQSQKITFSSGGRYNLSFSGTVLATYTVNASKGVLDYWWHKNIAQTKIRIIAYVRNKAITIAEIPFTTTNVRTQANSVTLTNTVAISSNIVLEVEQYDTLFLGTEIDITTELVAENTTTSFSSSITLENTNAITIALGSIDKAYQTGDTVNLATFIPKLKCKDFLNGLITMFNLYIEDVSDDYVEIKTFNDYYQDVSEAEDWTEKVDKTKGIKIHPSSNIIDGKEFVFRYAKSQDYYSKYYKERNKKEFGEKVYEVPSTFQKGQKMFEVPMQIAPPVSASQSNGGNTSTIYLPRIINETKQPVSGIAKLFMHFGNKNVLGSGTPRWQLTSTAGVNIAYDQYPAVRTFHLPTGAKGSEVSGLDLVFQTPTEMFHPLDAGITTYDNENLWRYWDVQINELTDKDTKIVKMFVRLNSEDIKNIDFSKLKIIDGVAYRLNKIVDYSINESTEIELIRIKKYTSIVPFPNNPPPNTPYKV